MALAEKYVSVELTETQCCVCGTPFAVPDLLLQNRRECGTSFFCPTGHSLVFKSENEQLKREKAKLQEQFFTEQRAHENTRRQLEKVEKRVSKGVCPCCKRNFVNLSRHMQTKHPDYGKRP